MIVSVAMDSDIEAARPWVQEANPDFVTLIDTEHRLSSLYNLVNVPQAVWIDETGRIVRPPESGGSIDILREFDPAAGAFKPEAMERAGRGKAIYMEAVKDWAVNGAASSHVFDTDAARQHLADMNDDAALAHARFALGRYLEEAGRGDEAQAVFAECRELHPDSWNIFRQTTEKMEGGIAAGEAFWGKVMALGERAYYEPVDMEGMHDL